MANRAYNERGIRKIQKSNGTYYITLPKELVAELKWREHQKVEVVKRGKKLTVQDWKE